MGPKKRILRVALPKGSLQNATLGLLRKAGFAFSVAERSYFPSIDDDQLEAMLLRAQEIATYVEDGVFDCGITGRDWVIETGAKVMEVGELVYSKESLRPVRWVLAVPKSSAIRSVQDLAGRRIATEVVNITRRYLRKHGVKATVEFSWGATEVKAPELVDAIVEVTETGRSLRANNLVIVDTVLESVTTLIANKVSWGDPWKREKIENLAMLLRGAIEAEGMVGLKLNIPQEHLERVVGMVHGLRNPTISPLHEPGWIALEIIIPEREVRRIIPDLKRAGARDIIEYPLNKIIY